MATAAEPTTMGEWVAGTSRASLVLKAVYLQVVSIACCLALGVAFNSTQPRFYSSVPWRLPLLVSYFVYLSVLSLILCYMELYLPRAPVAVREALKIVGIGALAGVLNFMFSFVLGLPVQDNRVVMGCTCFTALLIVGLLVLWAWLVREYGEEPLSSLCKESQRDVEVASFSRVAPVPV